MESLPLHGNLPAEVLRHADKYIGPNSRIPLRGTATLVRSEDWCWHLTVTFGGIDVLLTTDLPPKVESSACSTCTDADDGSRAGEGREEEEGEWGEELWGEEWVNPAGAIDWCLWTHGFATAMLPPILPTSPYQYDCPQYWQPLPEMLTQPLPEQVLGASARQPKGPKRVDNAAALRGSAAAKLLELQKVLGSAHFADGATSGEWVIN